MYFLADLKAKTTTIEAGFVHGAVLLHKAATQVPVLQGAQLAVAIVTDQPLGKVQQGA